jgi:hypothetical protein
LLPSEPVNPLFDPQDEFYYQCPGDLPQYVLMMEANGSKLKRSLIQTKISDGVSSNDIFSLSFANAQGGRFKMSVTTSGTSTTDFIAWSATSATLKANIIAGLGAIAYTVTITGTGTPADPFLISFTDHITHTVSIDTTSLYSARTYEIVKARRRYLRSIWVAVGGRDVDGNYSWTELNCTLNPFSAGRFGYGKPLWSMSDIGVAIDSDSPDYPTPPGHFIMFVGEAGLSSFNIPTTNPRTVAQTGFGFIKITIDGMQTIPLTVPLSAGSIQSAINALGGGLAVLVIDETSMITGQVAFKIIVTSDNATHSYSVDDSGAGPLASTPLKEIAGRTVIFNGSGNVNVVRAWPGCLDSVTGCPTSWQFVSPAAWADVLYPIANGVDNMSKQYMTTAFGVPKMTDS